MQCYHRVCGLVLVIAGQDRDSLFPPLILLLREYLLFFFFTLELFVVVFYNYCCPG